MTYGEIVKDKRNQLNLTLIDLSHLSGVSASYICEIENNKRKASAKITSRLNKVLYKEKPLTNETKNHNHYFIDVRGLDYIDPYMIAYLYNIDDPSGATQHALKKLLVPGKRGHKDVDTDLNNVVDTSNRLLEIKQQLAERDVKPKEVVHQYDVGDVWVLKGTTEYFKTVEVSHDRIFLEPLKGNKGVFFIYFTSLRNHYTKLNSRLSS